MDAQDECDVFVMHPDSRPTFAEGVAALEALVRTGKARAFTVIEDPDAPVGVLTRMTEGEREEYQLLRQQWAQEG